MRGREEMYKGRFGLNLTVENGYQAARLSAINALADRKYALGNLDRVQHIVRMVAFLRAPPELTEHPRVSNGAS